MNKQQLASKIWAAANEMRSKIEASEYKDYILGFIFYKFLSEQEETYLKKEGATEEDIKTLTEEDTEDAPVFPYVWEKIVPKIEGLPLVAHNSRFDEGCLREVFKVYQMDYPEYEFHDTLSASRNHFGCCLPDHQLQTVAAACGYDLTNHHHALADAEACAHIAIKLL